MRAGHTNVQERCGWVQECGGRRTPKNTVDIWGADNGNAYHEAFTDEKLFIVAGQEFQELEGYSLIFLNPLYGLKSPGKRWTEVIHGILRDTKFTPSKADPCIWLRKAPNLGAMSTLLSM